MEEFMTIEELNETNGGGKITALSVALVVGGIVTFLIGVVNGYQRPLTCKSSK